MASKHRQDKVAVIADGAAFGSDMERLVKLQRELVNKLAIYLPESFEWLILKSGLVIDENSDELINTAEYVGSKYSSWEQFFTELLIGSTRGDASKAYDKNRLNEYYIRSSSISKIFENIKGIEILRRRI